MIIYVKEHVPISETPICHLPIYFWAVSGTEYKVFTDETATAFPSDSFLIISITNLSLEMEKYFSSALIYNTLHKYTKTF